MTLLDSLLLAGGALLLLFVFLLIVGRKHERELAGKPPTLARPPENPILSPDRHEEWEAGGVFNPAAWYDGERVHLFYRAVGSDGVSRVGYALSADGIHFDERLPYPALAPRSGFGIPDAPPEGRERGYDPARNPSGGGWAGVEDPRASEVDGRLYLTFTAFDGWGFVRMAFTSLRADDVRGKRWDWRPPVFLSPPDEVHKNWVLFPEKIGGKFAILHSVSPSVEIAYVDDIEGVGTRTPFIKSRNGARGENGTKDGWDTSVRGVGPPPLKTPDGWLVLYHAMDKHDPDRYKLGALLLDLDDPSRILARAPEPLLAPDLWYENDGKPGVVYACGAIEKDGELFVYYGGGDKHSCVAHAPLSDILLWMKRADAPRPKLV